MRLPSRRMCAGRRFRACRVDSSAPASARNRRPPVLEGPRRSRGEALPRKWALLEAGKVIAVMRVALALLLVTVAPAVHAGPPAPAHDLDLPAIEPLVPPEDRWSFNECCEVGQVGPRDFYPAAQGPYLWFNEESVDALKQVGLWGRVIPGHTNFSYIRNFLPEEREKLPADSGMRMMIEELLENGYPIHTIFYHRFQGNPPPSEELLAIIDEQWIGDGQPETVYRLEPVFHYLKTGERWVGSSMGHWDPEVAKEFFANDLVPRLEEEFPFLHDAEHEWTRPELRKLSDLYCEIFYEPVGRALVWGMYVGNYHLASLPGTRAVGEKGADAFAAARLRGMNRQFGGGKLQVCWRGHEPTERYGYFARAWYSQRGDSWGLPLPHIWYYLYRPWLIGASYYINEGFPGSCMQDIEGDGQMELSTLGYIYRDMLDFVERHPERGTIVAPVALMLDYERSVPSRGVSYFGYNLPNDAADFFNQGVLATLFPEHRHAEGVGGYSRIGPFGEICDLLQPNKPPAGADPRVLENYDALLALGGMNFDEDLSAKAMEHVRAGGTLILCRPDIPDDWPAEICGLTAGEPVQSGGELICALCGHTTTEAPFALAQATLAGAEAIVTDAQGRAVVARNRVGEGHVITLLPAQYPVQAEQYEERDWRGVREQRRPILHFVAHLLEHLQAGAAPVEVRCRPEDRPDLSWHVARLGDGWLVTVYNFSLAREEIAMERQGTAAVHAVYPYKELPFQIVCRQAGIEDVIERYEDRDVNWETVDGRAVISETMRAGEIRVYELQPERIELPERTRFVNYALNRPVEASSTLQGYSPSAAVDGNTDNENYWWSDTDPQRHYVFEMPQWLQVDLGEERTIDHISVQFHVWKHESLHTRLRIYKHIVEASVDGETWRTVIDESRNEDVARIEGTERWFEAVQARYVRITVLRNSDLGGVRLVEMKVMGPERESYRPERRTIVPDWEVQYLPEVRDLPEERLVWLIDMEPTHLKPGWLPTGKTWEQMHGPILLVTDNSGQGGKYEKSLYGESISEVTYALNGRYESFVAAAGLGTSKPDASVEFIVKVDGQERFNSGVYRIGRPVLPVVVDVRGANVLTLIVTDAGDGLTNDYAWWGDARLTLAD